MISAVFLKECGNLNLYVKLVIDSFIIDIPSKYSSLFLFIKSTIFSSVLKAFDFRIFLISYNLCTV